MAVVVAILCERSRPGFGDQCQVLQKSLDAREVEDWAREAVKEQGWTVADGEYFCPRHDPAQQGEMVEITDTYQEIAPGVRARLPVGSSAFAWRIEIQVDEPDEPNERVRAAAKRLHEIMEQRPHPVVPRSAVINRDLEG